MVDDDLVRLFRNRSGVLQDGGRFPILQTTTADQVPVVIIRLQQDLLGLVLGVVIAKLQDPDLFLDPLRVAARRTVGTGARFPSA